MIQVRAPDGTVIQFPNGTDTSVIESNMRAYHDAATTERSRAMLAGPGTDRAAINGMMFNHGPSMSGVEAAVQTGVDNLFPATRHGYTPRQAFNATKTVQNQAQSDFAAAHPAASMAGNLTGALVNPASWAGGEWASGGVGLPAAMARGALVGGAEGGIAGGPGGAVTGALLGGALPIAGVGASRAVNAGRGMADSVRRFVGAADPADVATQRLIAAFSKDTRSGVDPVSALSGWRGNSSPTIADVGGENVRALVRDAGTQGPARSILAQYQKKTAADLQDHALALTAKLPPGTAQTSPDIINAADQSIAAATAAPQTVQSGQGGALLHAALNDRANTARAAVDTAYNAARAADPQAAHIESAALPGIAAAVRDSVSDYLPDAIPSVTKVLNGIDKLSTPTVRDLFEARQQLSTLRGVPDVQAKAAGSATRALDGQIQGAMDAGKITGDPDVVNTWRNAIASRRAFGQQFEGDDLIHALTSQELHGAGRVNAIAPEDASNAILGRTGVAPRANLTRDLSRITDFLGDDHPAVGALQQEAADRLLQPGAGSENFGDNLLRFHQANPDLSATLLPDGLIPRVQAAQQTVSDALAQKASVRAGQGVMRTSPPQFASDLGDVQLPLAQVGARTALADAIGNPTEGATGTLNRISSATNPGLNLDATFGPDAASAYRDGLSGEVDRMQNANWMAPQLGSKTAGSMQDAGHGLMGGIHGLIGGAISRVLGGAPLSDAERMAIVNPSIGELSPELLTSLLKVNGPSPFQGMTGYLAGPSAAYAGGASGGGT